MAPDLDTEMREKLEEGRIVTLALAFGAGIDVDALRQDLLSMEMVGALLTGSSSAFKYREDLWAFVEDGRFLGHVHDGMVEFPAIHDGLADAFDVHGESPPPSEHGNEEAGFSIPVDELEAPFEGPPIVVNFDETQGYTRP